jgi:hypothetical protein
MQISIVLSMIPPGIALSLRLLIERFIENGKLVRFLADQRIQQDPGYDNHPQENYNRFHQNGNNPRNDRGRDQERGKEPERRPDPRFTQERTGAKPYQHHKKTFRRYKRFRGVLEEEESLTRDGRHMQRQLRDFEVYSVQKPPKSQKRDTQVIGFSDDDYAGVSLPHTDALVLSLVIANHKIYRILIDTGSSADILYRSACEQMKIDRNR